MARPKLNRAQVEEMKDLWAKRDHNRSINLSHRFKVPPTTVKAVLGGTYICLEDYLEKAPPIICGRCGAAIPHTAERPKWLEHLHGLVEVKNGWKWVEGAKVPYQTIGSYHCEPCAKHCEAHPPKPTRKRKEVMQKRYLDQSAGVILRTAQIQTMNAGNVEIVVTDRDGERWLANQVDGTGPLVLTNAGATRISLSVGSKAQPGLSKLISDRAEAQSLATDQATAFPVAEVQAAGENE